MYFNIGDIVRFVKTNPNILYNRDLTICDIYEDEKSVFLEFEEIPDDNFISRFFRKKEDIVTIGSLVEQKLDYYDHHRHVYTVIDIIYGDSLESDYYKFQGMDDLFKAINYFPKKSRKNRIESI
jgi:hypothetical protein